MSALWVHNANDNRTHQSFLMFRIYCVLCLSDMDAAEASIGQPDPSPAADVRHLVSNQETPLRTVAATMRAVYEHLLNNEAGPPETFIEEAKELDRLERFSVEPVAVQKILIAGELSPRSFMALMANTLVRVLPTYSEIPLNLAVHGAYADLRNYGTIALNVKDEAGEGDPLRTHPALFNRSSRAISTVFDVDPLSIRVGLAALVLRGNEGKWNTDREGLSLVTEILLQDEFGVRLDSQQLLDEFKIACAYSELISPEALQCYRWRMQTIADIVVSQLRGDVSHDGYLRLLSLLAVREAAAADPENIFHAFSAMVVRYGGYLGSSQEKVADALCWSDVHIDEAVGNLEGYEGHSVEDDHAEQALAAVLDHLHGHSDLLVALQSMNALCANLRELWIGTVQVMSVQDDDRLPPRGIQSDIHERIREGRIQGVI